LILIIEKIDLILRLVVAFVEDPFPQAREAERDNSCFAVQTTTRQMLSVFVVRAQTRRKVVPFASPEAFSAFGTGQQIVKCPLVRNRAKVPLL
jgi:hypothetical protein